MFIIGTVAGGECDLPNGNWRLLRKAITLITLSLSHCPHASIYQTGGLRSSFDSPKTNGNRVRTQSTPTLRGSKEKAGCAGWVVCLLAHLDAHLADRTTVRVCDRADKLGRKTEIGVLWIMSGIVHHRSSSSVVSPSLVYLAKNQECSVQLDPAPSSPPLFPIIATAPSMTEDWFDRRPFNETVTPGKRLCQPRDFASQRF